MGGQGPFLVLGRSFLQPGCFWLGLILADSVMHSDANYVYVAKYVDLPILEWELKYVASIISLLE